jgi:hypothetical protein
MIGLDDKAAESRPPCVLILFCSPADEQLLGSVDMVCYKLND